MDMKKEYTTPEVEKVEFNYREQVVASPDCQYQFTNIGPQGGQCIENQDSTKLQ